MAFGQNRQVISRAGATAADIDVGLRAYMLKVYTYMCFGLALSGAAAFAVSTSPALISTMFNTPLKWVVLFAPVAMVFFLSFRIHRMSYASAQIAFWVYAGLMGISLAPIFLIYAGADITRVFLITSGAFAGLSLYGYTTKRDLTAFGSFLMIGLFGIIIASLVNIFIPSTALSFGISVVGVLVFAGLTAYDTQKIKEYYYAGDDAETQGKTAIMGALSLYLDFINLFLMLLRLFGNNRS